MGSRVGKPVEQVPSRLKTAIDRIIGRPVLEIAFKFGGNEVPDPGSSRSIDEVELFGVGDGRNQQINTLQGIPQLLDVPKVYNRNLASWEGFLILGMWLRVVSYRSHA